MPSFQGKADAFHDAADKNWSQFEKDLRRKGFQKAMLEHGLTDEKLRSYVQSYGDFLRSKDVETEVGSQRSSKRYKIKRLPGGRLGCSCKDWQFKRSHKGTDCKHIRALQNPIAKAASMSPKILRGFRMELEKLSAMGELRKSQCPSSHRGHVTGTGCCLSTEVAT